MKTASLITLSDLLVKSFDFYSLNNIELTAEMICFENSRLALPCSSVE